MKKNIFLLAACALFTSQVACAQSGKVEFSGMMTGLGDSLIVFSTDVEGQPKRDTVLVKNDMFEFTINVGRTSDIYVCTPGTDRNTERIGFRAIAVPGEQAVLTGDVNSSYYFSGSKFYEEYNVAGRFHEAAKTPLFMFADSLNNRIAAGADQDKIVAEYDAKLPLLQKQVDEAMLDFIRKHPDSEGAAVYVTQFNSLETAKKAVSLLSESVRNGRMKDYYQAFLDREQAQADREAEAAKKQAAGVEAPDFTLNDLNGNPLSLSSLRGKYVILDFWGTWCVWCIKGIPTLKEYYAKYKDKLEILSIDCNDSEEKWKEGVAKHEMPWLHVYQSYDGDTQTLMLYAVQGFPTKILIGPDGKIVKTFVGEDPSFYTFLDETLDK